MHFRHANNFSKEKTKYTLRIHIAVTKLYQHNYYYNVHPRIRLMYLYAKKEILYFISEKYICITISIIQ